MTNSSLHIHTFFLSKLHTNGKENCMRERTKPVHGIKAKQCYCTENEVGVKNEVDNRRLWEDRVNTKHTNS